MPDINEDQRKRLEAVNELILTESRYQTRLLTIRNNFLELSKLVLKEEDVWTIFQNVPELAVASQTLLAVFESSDPDHIGSIFHSNIIHLNELRTYCLGHAEANTRLQELLSSHKPFSKVTSEIQELPVCESLDLASFLLEPVQRLTRYSLLLRQILHYTNKDHPDHSATVQALTETEILLRETNEEVRVKENLAILRDLQSRLEKGLTKKRHGISGLFGRSQDKTKSITEKIPFNLVSETKSGTSRCLVHTGDFILATNKKLCQVYLFNDSLLVAKPNSEKSLELIETLISIETLFIDDSSLSNELVLKYEGSQLALLCEDEDDVDVWKHEIKTVQKNLAKSTAKKAFIKPLMQSFIGSASIKIISAVGVSKSRIPIICEAKIGFQESRSSEKPGPDVRWDESMILPVPHLNEDLELCLFSPQKFAPRVDLGRFRMPLDFLEYYANKPTDVIEVKLLGSSGHETGGKLSIQISYRPF